MLDQLNASHLDARDGYESQVPTGGHRNYGFAFLSPKLSEILQLTGSAHNLVII